jgi:uncharacterized protein (UPF0335 family)
LRAIIERLERLDEDKRAVAEQIKEVYAEAKGNGFDVKTIRRVFALRRQTPEARSEAEAMLDIYLNALGMGGTPLGEWAEAAAASALAAAGARVAGRVVGAFSEVEGAKIFVRHGARS